jgi:hypothetical protein
MFLKWKLQIVDLILQQAMLSIFPSSLFHAQVDCSECSFVH